MARKYRIALRNVQNVAASKTALIDIPIGYRVHAIILEHGYSAGTNTIAAAATNLTDVRVKLNGRAQRSFTGTQLRDMNLLMGTSFDFQGVPNTAPGVAMTIHLAEPWREDEQDQDALAWPTKWVGSDGKSYAFDSFQVEVDIGAASTPTLVAWAVVDTLVPTLTNGANQPGICKWIRQSAAASGTQFDFPGIERRDWLQQISIYPDSGGARQPNPVTLRKNGEIVHELSYSANFALLSSYKMFPTAGSARSTNLYDLVIDHDGLLGSAENMNDARDVSLTIQATAAMSGTTVLLIQRLGPPE